MRDFFISQNKDICPNILPIEQSFTFKKEEKLKSRKLIEHLFKQGKTFSNFPFRVIYIFEDQNAAPLQTGFAVSVKHFKKAVDRNRIKRLMREAYRLQKASLSDALEKYGRYMAVFFIYSGNQIPEYKDVSVKMSSALKRLNKIVDEVSTSNT